MKRRQKTACGCHSLKSYPKLFLEKYMYLKGDSNTMFLLHEYFMLIISVLIITTVKRHACGYEEYTVTGFGTEHTE